MEKRQQSSGVKFEYIEVKFDFFKQLHKMC